jgi:hypothetical protein
MTGVFTVIVAVLAHRRQKEANREVRQAEEAAFKERPEELDRRVKALTESQEGLEERATELAAILEDSRSAVQMGRLFNLYNKQIEKYQQETRTRATWSFVFAIFAMSAGFAFVVWGGSVLLTAKETIVLAAGGLIAAVGGGISTFITKTFLDVHRLSLSQLNRYFRQPVINDHILMAQRLADECEDSDTKKKSYEKIIDSIAQLITSQTTTNSDAA